ncbi:hypothetical protein ONE63_005623 [Megalurothrips usitatus]|uniref:Uncharacterized protein n=1 Tax=Megalurothrips usitatus TaxID=439358 RepID=A0AAV7XX57_9NEOP|nr:hypothetical protein ONE63_005623 [Megalurothrips usitatus]
MIMQRHHHPAMHHMLHPHLQYRPPFPIKNHHHNNNNNNNLKAAAATTAQPTSGPRHSIDAILGLHSSNSPRPSQRLTPDSCTGGESGGENSCHSDAASPSDLRCRLSDEEHDNSGNDGNSGGAGGRRRRRRRRQRRVPRQRRRRLHVRQEETPAEPHHLHHLPAARAGAGLREEPLPGRVLQGGAGREGQPARGPRPGQYQSAGRSRAGSPWPPAALRDDTPRAAGRQRGRGRGRGEGGRGCERGAGAEIDFSLIV